MRSLMAIAVTVGSLCLTQVAVAQGSPLDSGGVLGPTPPAVPPSSSAPSTGVVRVRILAEGEGQLTLHTTTERSTAVAFGGGRSAVAFGISFEEVCTAPCERTLPQGSYHFAVSEGVNQPVPDDQRVSVERDTTLSLSYESRRGRRLGGLLWMLIGGIGGVALGSVGLFTALDLFGDPFDDEAHDSTPGFVMAGVGYGVFLTSMIGGLILMASGRDRVSVRTTPGIAF